MNCAASLNLPTMECVAVEDSFNGLIAAKAARMKCIAVPHASDFDHPKWGAADARLRDLSAFTLSLINSL